MLNFNDLYDEFFNRRNKVVNPLHDEIKKLIETIANFKNVKNGEMLEQEIDKELGKPSSIETRIEDGMLFKKLTWNTPTGKFVKIIVSDIDPNNLEEQQSNPTPKTKEKSLEEQLKEAVEAENYELAIQLRDQIKGTKKTKRTRKEKKA